ncbi:MAG: DsbE family thiol:disulfide interchange protein [Parvibaculales bacterium]
MPIKMIEMPKSFLRLLPLLIFIGLIAIFAIGLQKGDPSKLPSVLQNRPLPEFELADLTSEQVLNRAPALINIWASWCAPCREEHPLLMKLAAQNIPIFGVNYKDDPQAAARFLTNLGDPYAASGSDIDGTLSMNLGVYGVPETFVIGPQGTILYRHTGPLTKAVIKDKIMPVFNP